MQIEEVESATLFEGNDFTINNQLLLEVSGLLRQFRKLIGDAPQVTRKNFHPSCAAMKLRANTVEFVFHINCSDSDVGRIPVLNESLPYRFCCWFGSRKHALDRAKDRQFRKVQFFSGSEGCGGADIAQEHVGFLYLV